MSSSPYAASGRIPIVETIAELQPPSAVWICDIWGVMHNGVAAFPRAVEACRRHRQSGGTVVLLSNAPRPASAVEMQLARLGVSRDAFDVIVTSGDLTRRWIAAHGDRPLYHLGPEKDRGLFEALPVQFAPLGDAELIICTGLFDEERETPGDYDERLREPAHRGLKMVCANPDLTVERGDRLLYCAGALAARYAALGGPVTYAGKPYPPVYDMAFEAIASLRGRAPEPDEMIAIGDGIRTDIAGARAVGIRSVFIASAVHVQEPLTAAVLERLFPAGAPAPIAALPSLA